MRKSAFKLAACALMTLALGLADAQAKSDYSGTWKLDGSKSDYGVLPPPDSLTETIAHNDPDLKVHVAQTGGTGDATYDMVYTTDGKECVNHPGGSEYKTTFHWDGDDLAADTKGSFEGNDFTAKDHWTLSDGGKTLTVQRHISATGADFDMKLVFAKQ